MLGNTTFFSRVEHEVLIPRQRNSSQEAVYARNGGLGMNGSIEFSRSFRLRGE